MANRFAVISGTWDGASNAIWAAVSGGVAGSAAAPTALDDVFIDAAAGAITVTAVAGAAARTLDCTGFTGTLTGPALFRGNVTLSTGGTFTGFTTTFDSGTATLTTLGKQMTGVTISTSTPSVTLADALSLSGTLSVGAGTLNTAGFAVTCALLSSNTSSVRTLTFGASAITITSGSVSALTASTATNLTVTANTATATFTANNAGTTVAAINWNGLSLVFLGAGAKTLGPGTFANLTVTGTTTKTETLSLTGNPTFTGTVTVNGNSATNRVLVQSSAVGTARTITAATVVASNVDFSDIAGAGAGSWNLSAITGGSGDAGGNSGITFTAATTRYAVVAGNWSSTATWSTVSGGAGGASVPLPQDTVVLDASSAAGTYTRDMPRIGKDINCTGFARTLTASVAHTAYGSVTFSAGMTLASGGFATTLSGRGSHTLTSAGQSWTGGLTIFAFGGTYTLADAFGGASTVFLTVTLGSFDTASFAMTLGTFSSTGTNTRAVTLGTSAVSLTATSGTLWNVVATGLTLSATSSSIVVSVASSSSRTLATGGLTYGTITYTVVGGTAGILIISNDSTIGTLNVSGSARTVRFGNNTTQSIASWNVFGQAGAVVSINTTFAGSAATISKASGYLASDYVSVQDITGTGGAAFYMGSRSTNVSGNTGLSFTDAPQRYATPGGFTWDATAGTKWAVVSGGTGGVAVPTSADDVYLDATAGAGTIVTSGNPPCKNLVCTGFTGTLNIASTIPVFGTVATMSAAMTVTGAGGLQIIGGAGVTCLLTSAGKTFGSFVQQSGTALALADALSVGGTFTHTSGTFTTNNFAVTANAFLSSNANVRTLSFGSSSITLTSTGTPWSTATNTNLTVTANTSTVTVTGAGSAFSTGSVSGALNYNGMSVVFSGAGAITVGGMTVANLTRTGAATKTDSISFTGNVTATGTASLTGNSTTNRVFVQSSVVGTARTITAATVVASNVDFSDIAGAGAGSWNLSAITGGSGDAGGNSGITFTPGAVNYWVGGSGNWSDVSHWASSSGGVGGTGRVPLPQGTARFDANSFTTGAQTVEVDMPRLSGVTDWTGATNAPTMHLGTAVTFFGSVTFITAMTFNGVQAITHAGRGTHVLTSASRVYPGAMTFLAPGGSYTCADAFADTNGITVTAGSLDTAGFAVSCSIFTSTGTSTRAVTFGASTVTLTSGSGTPWNVAVAGLTLSAASATIVLATASASTRTINGFSGSTIGTITYTVAASTGALILSSLDVGTLNVSGGARTLTLAGGAVTVTNWNVFGTAGNLVTVNASPAGTPRSLVKAGTDVADVDYLSITDIAATPAARWYAGTHSVDGGGNSGWTFTAAPTTQVGSQVDVRWATRGPVTSSAVVRWDTHLTVGAQRDVRWPVRTVIGASRALRWDTHVSTGRSVALRWDAHLTVGSSRALRWAQTALVGRSVQTLWQTRTHANADVTVRWTTRRLVAAERELRWTEGLTVGSQRTLRWTMTLPIRHGIYGGRLDGASSIRGGTLSGRRL